MPHLLTNSNIQLLIDLPLENYQLSRFDWTGKITELHFHGRPLTGREKATSANENFFGKGFYNEFGMDQSPGFEEAEVGEWFHKIGVGLLKKDSETYDFQHAYEVRPANFELFPKETSLHIRCTAPECQGYAYRLEKKIHLLETGFRIDYQLHNQGQKTINSQEYTHNFLAMGQQPMSPDHQLSFPFELQPASFGEKINPEGAITIEKKSLGFAQIPSQVFFFSQLSGGKRVEAYWELRHRALSLGISERGSFSTRKVNLWGSKHVISPELFVDISLAPGHSFEWSRTYQVHA